MRRASTPFFMFLFPSNPEEYDEIKVTYSQNSEIVFEKSKDDFEFGIIESKKIFSGYYYLTQEETNMFDHRYVLSIQVRMTQYGMSIPSQIFEVDVEDVLNDEVMQV